MILDSLRFINTILNRVLQNELGVPPPIMSLGGVNTSSVQTPLRLTLVNIDPEHAHHVAIGRTRSATSAPTQKQLYILISTNPEVSYEEALKLLEATTNWLDQNQLLNRQVHSDLPEPIERITIESYTQTLDGQALLWQGLGAGYQPSAVYKLRVMVSSDDGSTKDLPSVKG
ncbi:Pvc16 family protein [Psychroserpens luteolus]|uniref:Pvc16 family protein n=1 Tax=Psychroserpens luteolus TaxID=2855840 RepID=UPI001E57E8C2|nr:Pvc16 family protein [Psychroserpens luteolus]MCD2259650.1 DUF4255 domain-containing protein [Psychroserpens luteolus]